MADWWDEILDKGKELGSGLVDSVSSNALSWVNGELQSKVRSGDYVPGKSETVVSEPSPLPYDGPTKEAQAAAAAVQDQMGKYLKWGGLALGIVAVAAIIGGRR